MPPIPADQLEKVLCEVEKPVRYVGGEWNATLKADADVECRVALAYPDLYEIGMSHLGFRILYSLLNGKEGVAAERVFAPWMDCEAALRRHGVPLTTLETRRPLSEMDLIGFSMQYEMTVTNVLLMLDLGGVPLLAEDRKEGDPLVLAGGPVAVAPESFADFFDLIAIGDGEELFPELVDTYREMRRAGASRADIVAELGRLPGVYAPRHYRTERDPATGLAIVTGSDTHPFPVTRRILMDLGRHPFPQDVIVPFCEIVHSRVAVEIMRGCNVGCRFCQAGYIYRPERIRSADDVVATAIGTSEKTGFDEVSLTSLNTGEYPQIENVVSRLMDRFEASTTSVSLPSLRASSLTGGLLDEIGRVRKSGLTIAPEGGTQRMRDVINKNITEADIDGAANAAYSHGWDLIKLYFMIGQPTEREDDVVGIAKTAKRVLGFGQRHRGGRAKVNLGVSSFIPKPFTPFQWCPMDRPEVLRAKHDTIKSEIGRARIKFGRHEIGQSLVESALSRGDRVLSRVILRVYQDGGRFDGWSEGFDMPRWKQAFEAEGLSFDEYAHRTLAVDAALPWDHIDIGVRKSYLAEEWAAAQAAHVVTICSTQDCHGCGSFVKECLAGNVSHGREFPKRRERTPEPVAEADCITWRATYEKVGRPRFIGHLDLARTLGQAFRRARLDLVYTEGFRPGPKLSFGPPLPLGFAGHCEAIDLTLRGATDGSEIVRRVNAVLPAGIRLHAARPLVAGEPKLFRLATAGHYRAELAEDDALGVDLPLAVRDLLAQDVAVLRRERGGKTKESDLRPGILALVVAGPRTLEMTLRVTGQGAARPDDVVRLLVGRKVPLIRFTRLCLVHEDAGVITEPLADLTPAAEPEEAHASA